MVHMVVPWFSNPNMKKVPAWYPFEQPWHLPYAKQVVWILPSSPPYSGKAPCESLETNFFLKRGLQRSRTYFPTRRMWAWKGGHWHFTWMSSTETVDMGLNFAWCTPRMKFTTVKHRWRGGAEVPAFGKKLGIFQHQPHVGLVSTIPLLLPSSPEFLCSNFRLGFRLPPLLSEKRFQCFGLKLTEINFVKVSGKSAHCCPYLVGKQDRTSSNQHTSTTTKALWRRRA